MLYNVQSRANFTKFEISARVKFLFNCCLLKLKAFAILILFHVSMHFLNNLFFFQCKFGLKQLDLKLTERLQSTV